VSAASGSLGAAVFLPATLLVNLNAISIPPRNGKPPQRLFVGLHGWGANAADLAGLAPLLAFDDCLLAFPDAPFAHPHVAEGRAWYDLETRDRDQLARSRAGLVTWLQELLDSTGLSGDRLVLSGFSQGGAMALDVGLVLPLAGVVCLSGYLHEPPSARSPFPPVLLVHGSLDPVVPIVRRARRGMRWWRRASRSITGSSRCSTKFSLPWWRWCSSSWRHGRRAPDGGLSAFPQLAPLTECDHC